MPPVRNLAPGNTVIYPNRDKAASKATKFVIVVLLLVSVGLMLLVTFGGWSKLEGLKPVNFSWCLVYVVMAVYIARWTRGLLPLAAAMAILLLILTLIAGLGVSGTSWFDRSNPGFGGADSLFGGGGLSPNLLGLLTLLIAPVQVLLLLFSMRGFAQGWNVEQEVSIEEADRRGSSRAASPPRRPAAA